VVDAKYKGLFEDADANVESKPGEQVQLELELKELPDFRYRPSNQDLYQIIAYSTLFASTLPASRRAFLAVPVVATQRDGEHLLQSWRRALDRNGFAGDTLVPSFKTPIPAGLELLVGILPAPLPVKEKAP
jgi:hypothetical protein